MNRKFVDWVFIVFVGFVVLISIRAATLSPRIQAHAHQYHDVRFRFVEVLNVENDNIAVADLEDNTVGPDLVYKADPKFTAGEGVEGEKGLRVTQLRLSDLRHKRGVLSYCSFCGRALSLMFWKLEGRLR